MVQGLGTYRLFGVEMQNRMMVLSGNSQDGGSKSDVAECHGFRPLANIPAKYIVLALGDWSTTMFR